MRIKPGKRLWREATDKHQIEVTEERGTRSLHLGTCAIQSAMRISRPWDLELAYTRAMMAYLMFTPCPEAVLMVGLGGGSLAKFIRKHRPETRITAVEINDQVIAAARAHFEVPPDDDTLQVIEADGAIYVRQHPASADVILLDGFDAGNQVEALATETFYAACRRALKPHGVLVVNLWGRDADFSDYFSRLLHAFDGELGWLSIMGKTNVIVFAFADPGARDDLEAVRPHLAQLGKRYGLDFSGFARDFQWASEIAPLFA
ncbi:MAG: polyamine aminopropyltransferase [Thiobacillaceae bacterium]